ncbi:EamA-like transporter family protein [Rhizobiales bacterium GAS191]|nr:EamA-like transporter family protein [Rhizobiales bacterium GAS113]SEE89681.1 EamA-like transporter family protein [Rhizobiales bacterium GAS191]
MSASRPSPAGSIASGAAALPRAAAPLSFRGLVFGLLSAVIWGIQPIVSKLSIADNLTAADVTVLRFLASGLVLLPVAMRAGRFPVGPLGWGRACALSALAGAPFSLAIVGGVAFAPPLHSAVVSPGLIPVVAMALAFFVQREAPRRAELASVGLVLIGLALFSFEALSGAPAREGAWFGDLLFVASAVMWASFGFLAKRWHANSFAATAAIAILSLISVPLWAVFLPLNLWQAAPSAILLQAGFQGLLVGVVALYLYTRTVALLGSVQAALFVPLVPIVTALADLLYLGELPSVAEALGMVVVVAGMMLCVLAPRLSGAVASA